VNLPEPECWRRLEGARHGVLSTMHPERGVDAVPCVFAVVEGRVVVPIDTIKPKRHLSLQRLANIDFDRRCALLVDHYEPDWLRLWWVRVHASAERVDDPGPWLGPLAGKYAQYADAGAGAGAGAVRAVLVLTPTAVSGWAAAG
jgi:PPOX class probable F420-dependent enzyme